MQAISSSRLPNSSRARFLVAALFAILCSSVASGQNVLVWSTGNNDGIDSTPGVAAWLQASGQFTSVTGVDADSMTLAQLLAYDRVLYFSNGSHAQNPVAIGNTLADYADTGRRLVLATFSWASQGDNTLSGRIITDQLSPYLVQGSSLYTNVTMQSHDATSFFTGVNSLSGYFHDDIMLSGGATSHGLWTDGESLLATKGNVVAVNLFPDDASGSIGGDYRKLFVNALTVVPEPSSAILPLIGLCCMCTRTMRRR